MSNPVTSGTSRKWHHYLTIDLVASVLSNSIFHPFIAWLIPLCLRAIQAPTDSIEFMLACLYAAVVTLLWSFTVINRRVAWGLPRPVDWTDEVVVITGGANGLGSILAETYGMRGASVAVLDLAEPEAGEARGVRYYRCDVADAAAVERAAEQIKLDLGVPTILINNAAVVHGKCTWDLTAAEVQRTLAVNLGAHFHTLRTFLPGMLQADGGGTVVTVASVMGKLHAAQLSDYCASKAGLIAMHNALRFELARESAPEGAAFIRTVLVNPGHLATRLFAGVCTTSHFFGPTLEPVELAREIVRKVDAGENGEINSPFYARWIEWNFVLPMGVQKMLRILTGVDEAMGLANEKAAKRE